MITTNLDLTGTVATGALTHRDAARRRLHPSPNLTYRGVPAPGPAATPGIARRSTSMRLSAGDIINTVLCTQSLTRRSRISCAASTSNDTGVTVQDQVSSGVAGNSSIRARCRRCRSPWTALMGETWLLRFVGRQPDAFVGDVDASDIPSLTRQIARIAAATHRCRGLCPGVRPL